jgi:hypothetical protein
MPRLTAASLAPRIGHGVRVAVVDSGVHSQHPHVQGVAAGIGIDAAGGVSADYVDRLGHGTAVTAVIRERAPGAEVLAIKVFDRELATTGEALVAALEWAIAHDARIINLSLGTANQTHTLALQRAVDRATAAGITIVAAAPDATTRWLPGALEHVVAVEADMLMPREQCEVTIAADGACRVRASGYPRPIPGVPPERNLRGVSFAVANASGLLALLFEGSRRGTSVGECALQQHVPARE